MDGKHTYTLYVSITVPEAKVKIKKGHDLGWKRIPETIKELLNASTSEQIQDAKEHGNH